MPRLRLGVVLVVPQPLATEMDGLRRALGDGALGRIPAHLTLVPPVNVREDDLGAGLAHLRTVAAETAPITVELGPPATFSPVTPVVYLPVTSGADAVRRIRDDVFVPPFERHLTYAFVPHVTLADEVTPERIAQAIDALRDFRVQARFDAVHVLQELEGRRWESIAEARFHPRHVVGRGGVELELAVTVHPDLEAAEFARAAWAEVDAERDPGVAEQPFAVTARRNGQIVGVADGAIFADECYLAHLVVERDLRNLGIGARLLAAVESLAAERGCDHLTVRTLADGGARRFYERHGWRWTADLPRYRRGRDFAVLRRGLG